MKLIETFSYMGEDQTVVKMYERFQKILGKGEIVPPFMKHLVAVALARTGDEKGARKLWKEALSEDETLQIAQNNLDDLKKRPGERSGAWPFPFQQWIPVQWVEKLIETTSARSETALKRQVERLMRDLPELQAVLPILLERGDPPGRQLALHLASDFPFPALRDFVLSPHGTDDDRLQASQYAVEHGMLPRGKPLPMYRDGKPQELLLLNYEIHDEPQRGNLPKAARRLLEQSAAAVRQANYEEALKLAQEGLKIAPDAPPLMNGVAAALGGLGRRQEMEGMIQRMAELHPDYLFARCAMVRLCVDEGQLDEAQQWLDPLLERPRFHVSEFSAVCMAQIELLEARGLRDGARSWLAMWEQSDPDAWQLPIFRQRLKRK